MPATPKATTATSALAAALLLLSRAEPSTGAAAAASKKPVQGQPIVMPLTYKPRSYAQPLAAGAWSTMAVGDGAAAKTVSGSVVGGWAWVVNPTSWCRQYG